MPVPLLDLRRQYAPLKEEITKAIVSLAESQHFILGPEVDLLEAACAEYCRTTFALGVSSGTDALLLALMAEELPSGAEVITSPYSFFATVGSIVRAGARPVFVDIEPRGYNINVEMIERVVTPETKAIMPVHLFGQCAEMEQILSLARARKLAIIEDAAQALGSELGAQRAGSFGEYGCFSFFPSKNLGAFGDAGLVTTSDKDRFERLKMLRVHGAKTKYYHDLVGANFRIDALQAAVLRVKLPHLDSWTGGRQKNAELYRKLFTQSGVLSSHPVYPEPGRVALPAELPNRRHIYNQFVIRVTGRDEVMNRLREWQIGAEVYYPVPLHLQRCFRGLGHSAGDFPESERAARESLAIPIFPELTPAEIEEVVSRVIDALRKQSSYLVRDE